MKLRKRHIAVLLVLVLILGLITGCASAANSKGSVMSERAVEYVRRNVWKAIAGKEGGSAGIAVVENGKAIYAESFGMADREKSIPVDKDTVFNIGSVSKVFCAAAIMLLVDEGKVDLNGSVVDYIPEFTMADDRYKDITVEMLLDHSSGLPGSSYTNSTGYKRNLNKPQEILDVLKTANLKHAPGEKAMYCNDGFTLAEIIVERVSGKSYADFVQERIFKPLSMDKAGVGVAERSGITAARYYSTDTGKCYPAETLSSLGSGGLAMTPEDLARFGDSFTKDGRKILSDASLKEMNAIHATIFNQNLGSDRLFLPFGLGWDIVELDEFKNQGIQLLGKSGTTSQFSSFLAVLPEQGISVAVIFTGPGGPASSLAIAAASIILEDRGIKKPKDQTVTGPEASQQIPDDIIANNRGYWIAGSMLLRLDFDADGKTATFYNLQDGGESTLDSFTYRNGFFYDSSGSEFQFVEANGNRCFITYQMGRGILFQKVMDDGAAQTLGIDMDGKTWLKRNIAPYEIAGCSGKYVVKSSLFEELPDIIDFSGIKKVQAGDYAGMAAAIRDQSELYLFKKDGDTWARVSDKIFSPAAAAARSVSGANEIRIGREAYAEWLAVAVDCVLSFEMPDEGRILVCSYDGEVLYDSVVDDKDKYVTAGAYVACAGKTGDTFTITVKE